MLGNHSLIVLGLVVTGILLFAGSKSVVEYTTVEAPVHIEEAKEGIQKELPTLAPSIKPTQKPTKPKKKHNYPRTTKLTKHATIVVQLSGEMANNLQHIAHGVGLQLWAKEDFDIDMNLVLRHYEGPNNRQRFPKWKSARDNLQACFPNLATMSFGEGNKKDFQIRQDLQKRWLGDKMDMLFGLLNSEHKGQIVEGLGLLANDILLDPGRPLLTDDSNIRLPYILAETLDAFPMIDRYYSDIVQFLHFNDTACCGNLRPGPSDSVFHFRNYQSEMPVERAYQMGFAELSPAKVAREVFPLAKETRLQHHIYITTRIYNQIARNYVEALMEPVNQITQVSSTQVHRNASIVTDQSAVQDFCFLKSATFELVGSARSTFVFWAALLSKSLQLGRLYHVDNAGLRARHPRFWERFAYNFTHPLLKDRIRFELYKAEELED